MFVESLADGARRQIQKWIATGELKPGQQLKEEEIARRLDTSRPPIREAFKTLESEGLVVRKPRKGVFVTEMTEKDIWEVYTLKATLYEMAVGLAMEKITQGQIRELAELVEKMQVCVNAGPPDILGYQKFHRAFHILILDIAGNQRLKQFASNLHRQIQRFSYQTLHDQDHLIASIAYHQQILESIVQGRRDEACRLMNIHVIEALEVLNAIMAAQAQTEETASSSEGTRSSALA